MNSSVEEKKEEKDFYDASSINFDVISKLSIGGDHFHSQPHQQKQKSKELFIKKTTCIPNMQKESSKNDNIDYTELDCYFKQFISSSLKYQSKHKTISNFNIKDLIIRKKPQMKSEAFLGSKRGRNKFVVKTKKIVGNIMNKTKISIIKIPKEEEEIVDLNNCNTQISSNNTGSEINHKVFFKILNQ